MPPSKGKVLAMVPFDRSAEEDSRVDTGEVVSTSPKSTGARGRGADRLITVLGLLVLAGLLAYLWFAG